MLEPPRDAPPWESAYADAFNDDYTRQSLRLEGRAPHDVLDQQLFAARLGHAHVVALVEVRQVWGRGRYQGSQNQYVTVRIDEVLMGEIPKLTDDEVLIQVDSHDELPGTLQGQSMLMFVRWAPGESPPFHHHLMPADDDIVAFIHAMVEHAQAEGVLDAKGGIRRTPRTKRKRRGKGRDVSTDANPPPTSGVDPDASACAIGRSAAPPSDKTTA